METEEITDKKQSDILLYTIGSVLVVAIGLIIYTYLSFDILKKGEINKQYIKKENLSFYSLPYSIQDKYITKVSSNDKINILNKEIKQIKKSKQILEEEKKIVEEPIYIEPIVEVIKEESIKIVKDEIIAKEFDVFKCYDMSDGGFYQSDISIKKLYKFLEEHKSAKYFEIIGVVNKLDFKLLRDAKPNLDNKQLNLIEQLSQLGLSRKRVVEGSWNLKQYLGEDVNLRVVNYTITSQKNHKGFVIRAYR